jgi:hypothetical protein
MPLFPNRNGRARQSGKASLAKLDVLCSQTAAHPLPVRMKCIGMSTSNKGNPMAVYACPFHGCSFREGWVEDGRGKPTRLWRGDNHRFRHKKG